MPVVRRWNGSVWEIIAAGAAANMVTTDTVQTITGVKTFSSAPIVPDASFAVSKLSATGTRDATTYLRGDNTWATVATGAPANMVTTDTTQTISGAKTFTTGVHANVDSPLSGGVTDAQANGLRVGSRAGIMSFPEPASFAGTWLTDNLYWDGTTYRLRGTTTKISSYLAILGTGMEWVYYPAGSAGSAVGAATFGLKIDNTGALVSKKITAETGGLWDGVNRAYSDSNPPETLTMTQFASGSVATPAAGLTTLHSPDGKSLALRAPDGTLTTIGSGGGGGAGATFASSYKYGD